VLLAHGRGSVPVAQVPPVGAAGASPALPMVSVTSTPSNARLTGHQRNPFSQQVKQSSTTSSAKAHAPAHSSNAATATGGIGGTKTTVTSPATTTTTTTTTTPTTTTTTPSETAPSGLTATQAYAVTLSTTNAGGGVRTIDPERLSILPSAQLPFLVELGVLKGGHRVIFVVRPGTVVEGVGTCTPGPIDCEILSLSPGEIEGVGVTGSNGATTGVIMSVTGINAVGYPSSAAAEEARLAESAVGRRLLNPPSPTALSLFQYKPSLGAVVDLSNVTVGGS